MISADTVPENPWKNTLIHEIYLMYTTVSRLTLGNLLRGKIASSEISVT
jgi:hypothetical protein